MVDWKEAMAATAVLSSKTCVYLLSLMRLDQKRRITYAEKIEAGHTNAVRQRVVRLLGYECVRIVPPLRLVVVRHLYPAEYGTDQAR